MEMKITLMLAGLASLLLVGSGFANARRGIGRWSLIPWDYAMILSAICLVALAARLAILWRDSA